MYIILMLLCIILSAYFSLAETAYLNVNKSKLKSLAEKGNKKAIRALNLSEKEDKLISTALIMNNAVNIAFAAISTIFFIDLIKDNNIEIVIPCLLSYEKNSVYKNLEDVEIEIKKEIESIKKYFEGKKYVFEGFSPQLLYFAFPLEDIDGLRGEEGFYEGLR